MLDDAVAAPMDYAASVAGSIASRIEGASFPGLFTRVEIDSHLGDRIPQTMERMG